MHAISQNGLAFQSIINIIIERKPFHKGSTTATTTTVSTKAGIKQFFHQSLLLFRSLSTSVEYFFTKKIKY